MKRKREEKARCEKLYRQNRKINKKLKRERLLKWVDNVFLHKLLINSYRNNKRMLLKIL